MILRLWVNVTAEWAAKVAPCTEPRCPQDGRLACCYAMYGYPDPSFLTRIFARVIITWLGFYHRSSNMKSHSSREILKILFDDGWKEVRYRGDHLQLKHPLKKGLVTVPHPNKDFPIKTIKSILKQAGLKL